MSRQSTSGILVWISSNSSLRAAFYDSKNFLPLGLFAKFVQLSVKDQLLANGWSVFSMCAQKRMRAAGAQQRRCQSGLHLLIMLTMCRWWRIVEATCSLDVMLKAFNDVADCRTSNVGLIDWSSNSCTGTQRHTGTTFCSHQTWSWLIKNTFIMTNWFLRLTMALHCHWEITKITCLIDYRSIEQ